MKNHYNTLWSPLYLLPRYFVGAMNRALLLASKCHWRLLWEKHWHLPILSSKGMTRFMRNLVAKWWLSTWQPKNHEGSKSVGRLQRPIKGHNCHHGAKEVELSATTLVQSASILYYVLIRFLIPQYFTTTDRYNNLSHESLNPPQVSYFQFHIHTRPL